MTLLALMMLRVVIGVHFYNEGVGKIRSGNFTAAPFLQQACGPAAGFFHGLIDDYDGRYRLSVSPTEGNKIVLVRTIAIWEEFRDQCQLKWMLDETDTAAIDSALEQATLEFEDLIAQNEVAMTGWLRGEARLDGFQRDGDQGGPTADEVASLREQVKQINDKRRAEAAGWFSTIESIWNNYEATVNEIGKRNGKPFARLARPHAPQNSPLALINRFLPWFDLIVGGLLVVGLFTRLTALAAISLLFGVVTTQPFWIATAQPTFYQWVEIAGLLVVIGAAAGRFGGLDYFLIRSKQNTTTTGTGNE